MRELMENQLSPEQETTPEKLYHGSVTAGIEEFEPRKRSIPAGVDPETHPALTYASDNPAFAAAHSFPWGTSEGFELSVKEDGVFFRVPVDQKDRLNVLVYVYTIPGKHFSRTPGEGTGHTFHTDRYTKPTAVESFATVEEAIEHFGGRVEYYEKGKE